MWTTIPKKKKNSVTEKNWLVIIRDVVSFPNQGE